MIYCVVPEALEGELYEKLCSYYSADQNVTVIVDRRKQERRGARQDQAGDGANPRREVRDRRRQRITGEFPPLEQG